MPIDWETFWTDLNIRQQTFLIVVYERECELARFYKSQHALGDPLLQGAEWRWQEHGIVGGNITQKLAKAGIPAVADLGQRIWQAGYQDTGIGATYALLETRGWLERRYVTKYHPIGGDYATLEVRLTRRGRKLASLHSSKTQRSPGQIWRDSIQEQVEELLEAPEPFREWLQCQSAETAVGDAYGRRDGVNPIGVVGTIERKTVLRNSDV